MRWTDSIEEVFVKLLAEDSVSFKYLIVNEQLYSSQLMLALKVLHQHILDSEYKIEIILPFLSHKDTLIRAMAIYAIAEFTSDERVLKVLNERYLVEVDSSIRSHIENYLTWSAIMFT